MAGKVGKAAVIIAGVLTGLYIGWGIYDYLYLVKLHPEVYDLQSAPWYTGSLVRGIVFVPLVIVCIIVRITAGKTE